MLDYKKVVNFYDIQRIIDAMCVFGDIELERMVIDEVVTLIFCDDYGVFAIDVDWNTESKEYSMDVRSKEFDRMGEVFYKKSNVRGKGMLGLTEDIKYLVTNKKY